MTPSLLAAFGLAVTVPSGAICCAAALIVERLTTFHRLREAAWRSAAAVIVAAAFVGPLFVLAAPRALAIKLSSPVSSSVAPVLAAPPSPRPLVWIELKEPLSKALLILAGSGTLLSLGNLGLGLHRMRRVMAGATLLANPALQAQVRAWSTRLALDEPRVLVSAEVSTAFAAGGPDPRVILPKALLASSSKGALSLVCAHELAHIKRGDPSRVLVDRLLAAAFWFNPFVRVAVSRLAAAREMACDDIVLQDATPTTRRLYAATLLSALQHAGRTALHPALIRPQGDHVMRLHAVLRPALPPRRAKAVMLMILLALGAGSAAGIVAASAGALQAVSKATAKPAVSYTTKSDTYIEADNVTSDRGHITYFGSQAVRAGGDELRVKVDGHFVTGRVNYERGQVAAVELWQRWRPDVAAHGGDARHDVLEVTLAR